MENKSKGYKIKNPLMKVQTLWYKYIIARKVAPAPKKEMSKNISPRHLYAQVCFHRYKTTREIYDQQFLKEISVIEKYQPTAWDAMRMRRLFSITMLWPPMHSKREVSQTFQNNEMKKKTKDQKHLEKLLK